MNEKLSKPIGKTIRTAFNLSKEEGTLIITDEDKLPIAKAFADQIGKLGAQVNTYLLLEENRPYTELTHFLKHSINNVNLLIYMLRKIPEEKPFRIELVAEGRKHARVCMMPGVTEPMLERTLDVDHDELQEFTYRVMGFLKNGEKIHVTDVGGTDVSFSVKGREFQSNVGRVTRRGGYGNLPAGETFTAPVEDSFTGVIYFEEISDPDTKEGYLKFEQGEVVDHSDVSDELKRLLKKEENRVIGEFGVGTNPKAHPVPNFLEAEKARHTVHFAIGDSYGLGRNKSPHHIDFLVNKPTVTVDGDVLMENGKFKI